MLHISGSEQLAMKALLIALLQLFFVMLFIQIKSMFVFNLLICVVFVFVKNNCILIGV